MVDLNVREILERRAEAPIPRICEGVENLLGFPDSEYELVALPWLDTGVRTEEGFPVELEEPEIWFSISAVHRETKEHGYALPVRSNELPELLKHFPIDAMLREKIGQMVEEAQRLQEGVFMYLNQALAVTALKVGK